MEASSMIRLRRPSLKPHGSTNLLDAESKESAASSADRVCSPPIPRVVLERRISTTTEKELRKIDADRKHSRTWMTPLVIMATTGGATIYWFATSDRFSEADSRSPYITFIGTVMAATIAGVISLRVFLYSPSRLRRIELLLLYVERQLGELWGPLYGLLTLSQHHYGQVLHHLEQPPFQVEGSGDQEALHLLDGQPINGVVIRRAPVSVDPFSLIEPGPTGGDKWRHWVTYSKEHALPWNDKVAKLLTKNYALIGQDHLPDLQRFLAHEAEYQAVHKRALADQAEKRWIGADYKLNALFPEAFEYHVYHKIRFLLYLQKKYRLQIEGAKPKVLREVTKKGARHREMSRSRPAERVGRAAEQWAWETIGKLEQHHPQYRRSRLKQNSIDCVWLAAQLATPLLDPPVEGSQPAVHDEVEVRLAASQRQLVATLEESRREFAKEGMYFPEEKELQESLMHLASLGAMELTPQRRSIDRQNPGKPEWTLVGSKEFTQALKNEVQLTIDVDRGTRTTRAADAPSQVAAAQPTGR